mgnify:FL=1
MKILLNSVIIAHYLLVFTLVAAIPLAIIYQPWYLAAVIVTVIVRIATSREECPLSSVEAYLQEKLNLPKKTKFIKHHVMEDFPIINRIINRFRG